MSMYVKMKLHVQKSREKEIGINGRCGAFLLLLLVKWECKPSKLSPYACLTAQFNAHSPSTAAAFSLDSPSVFIFSNKQRWKKEISMDTYDISRDLFTTDWITSILLWQQPLLSLSLSKTFRTQISNSINLFILLFDNLLRCRRCY